MGRKKQLFCQVMYLVNIVLLTVSHSRSLISNSPYCFPYNSHDVSSENLVLD